MIDVFKALTDIKNHSGRNDKEALLRRNATVPMFKEVLKFVFDPYIRTGIGKAKLKKGTALQCGHISFENMIEHFTTNQTGTNDDVNFAKAFVDQFPDFKDLAEGIVTKTLKIGVTENTLNKVYGDAFIPLIGIMKGETYEDYKHKVEWPVICTEKIDGARRLLIKENGRVSMYSRSGIPDDGLVEIIEEAKHLPDNCVYDGELAAKGKFDNFIELRQATNAIASTKGERTGLNYRLFDMMPIEDYKRGKSKHIARIRKILLGALFGDESIECLAPTTYKEAIELNKLDFKFTHISPLEILGIVNDHEGVMWFAEMIWRRGGEGTMLNTANGMYDLIKDRTKDLLKVKHTEDMEVKVIDVEIGKEGTKNESRLGSLIVDYQGHRVGVGMGLDDDKRIKWWDNPSLIVGKHIEITTFGQSKNKQGGLSLNCAVFKRVVGDE